LGHGKKPEGEGKKDIKGKGGFKKDFTLFLVFFFIIWLFSYLLTTRFPGLVTNLQDFVAREVAFVLRSLGYKFTLNGSEFLFATSHGGEKLFIIAECTGLYTSIIYFSIIGAYPARITEKLIGLLIGIPIIHILNLFRMVFISFILYHRRDLFDFFHGYFWQISFVIFMLLIVLFWMGKIVKPDTALSEPSGGDGKGDTKGYKR